jgi:F0F1-type ATP synthase assembly protein I
MPMSGNGKEKEDSQSGRKAALQSFSWAFTLSVEIAVAVIAPTVLGWWLDGKTGKSPWFTIGGMILGSAAAARSVHRTVTEVSRKQREDEESSNKESSE